MGAPRHDRTTPTSPGCSTDAPMVTPMTTAVGRVCLACGDRAALTRAHLIGRALQKLLPPSESGTTYTRSTPGSGIRGDLAWRDHSTSSLELQVKRLCGPCNRDWMGRLEAETRGVIAEMAGGKEVDLNPALAAAVATWSCLVALLRGTAEAQPWGFTEAEAREMRRLTAPPAGSHVWLLRGNRRTDFMTRTMVAIDLDADRPLHATYLRLGQLTIIVATSHLASGLDLLFNSRRYSTLSVDLHPKRWTTPRWPPASIVEDPDLDRIFTALARAFAQQEQ